MHYRQILWSCAGGLLLVLASASYAADVPTDMTPSTPPEATMAPADATPAAPADGTAAAPADAAATSQPQVAAETPADERMSSAPAKSAEKTAMATPMALPVVNDPGKVYLIRENPFFSLHIDKAIQHARDAEIAGNMGQAVELREHAKMSLMRAREAQRAGNVAGLNEGIANLTKALSPPQTSTQTSSAMGTADPRCIDELQRECGDVQPGSGRIQQCFDDKINNFSSMCQEKLKEGKAAIAAAVTTTRHEQSLSGTQRTEAAVRSATDAVREARKNLSEAGGLKYKEIKPQTVKTVAQ